MLSERQTKSSYAHGSTHILSQQDSGEREGEGELVPDLLKCPSSGTLDGGANHSLKISGNLYEKSEILGRNPFEI